jgi:hypothetical protein
MIPTESSLPHSSKPRFDSLEAMTVVTVSIGFPLFLIRSGSTLIRFEI